MTADSAAIADRNAERTMTKPPVTAFPQPRLRSRSPLRRSAHYSQGLADRVDDWFLSWGMLTDPRQQAVFRRTNHTYLAAVCWPRSGPRALYDLARLAAALMARDHEIDTAPHDDALRNAHAFLTEVRTHYTVPAAEGTDPRWTPVFADLWRSIAAYHSERFMTRLADALADFVTGCLTYRQTTAQAGRPIEVEHYLRTRRTTIAQRIDHLLTEMSLGFELDEPLLTHPLLEQLLALDVDRTILVQDILSAPRELADGETENLIAVLASCRSCTVHDALVEATTLYEHVTDAYDQTHAALLDTTVGAQSAIRDFASALNDFNAGLIEWTSTSIRYTQADTSHWNTPDEIVTGNIAGTRWPGAALPSTTSGIPLSHSGDQPQEPN
jgi:hypothetical protein